MQEKILIAYASRYGSTAEIAREMAKAYENRGMGVDICPVDRVKDISVYKNIIVGSAIQKAQWLPEALKFIKENRQVLRRIPTAYFTVCLTMAKDNQTSRYTAERFLDAVHEYNHADIEGFFGGVLDYARLSWIDRMLMKSRARVKEGDYRDWSAIRAWTDDAYLRLNA